MKRLARSSLGVKLGASFALVALLLFVSAAVALSGASSQGASATKLSTKLLVTKEAMQVKFRGADFKGWQTAYAFDIIRGVKAATADNAASRSAFLASAASFRRELALVQGEQLTDAQRAQVATASTAFDQFMATDKQVIGLYRAGTARGAAQANALVLGREIMLFTTISSAIDKLVATVSQQGAQARLDAASAQSTASTLVIIVGIMAVLLSATVAVLLTRHIKRHVARILERLDVIKNQGADRLKEGLEALAAGDLTRHLATTTTPITDFPGDEFGQIMRDVEETRDRLVACFYAYNASAENLRTMVGTVSSTAATVSAASQQMSSTCEETGKATGEIAQAVSEVAEGAERQVQLIDEARRSAEEVSKAVAESAQTASSTAELAHDARQVAQDGVGAAERADEAMRSVQTSSTAVTDAISELAGKSEQIGAIVQTITGIAEQTNLLALNAAIEAARAGEQGRGFAVVAEEVRKLAEESRGAAAEISELIGAIQHETTKAVGVVKDGARRTEEGAGVVAETKEAFVRIGTSVDDIATRIEQIAATSQQITASANSMHQTINDVAAVAEESSASTEEVSASTEQTSASTQQIAASAHELATNAEHLNELVGRFKTTA